MAEINFNFNALKTGTTVRKTVKCCWPQCDWKLFSKLRKGCKAVLRKIFRRFQSEICKIFIPTFFQPHLQKSYPWHHHQDENPTRLRISSYRFHLRNKNHSVMKHGRERIAWKSSWESLRKQKTMPKDWTRRLSTISFWEGLNRNQISSLTIQSS